MTTLTDFILARLAEDEAVALDALAIESIYAGHVWHWSVTHEGGSRWHPTRHDPARVLRDVERDRRIVEWCQIAGSEGLDVDAWTIAKKILRELASIYSDHDDYRDEWRP